MSVSVTEMQQLVAAGLSMRSRAGYTLLLLAAIGMTGLTGSLLATEPTVPGRTQVALATLTVIGIAWAVLAAWTLARRHVLLAEHRIAASWLAISASALFLTGAVALRNELPAAAIVVAGIMMVGALACMVYARRYRARLIARRDALLATSRGRQ